MFHPKKKQLILLFLKNLLALYLCMSRQAPLFNDPETLQASQKARRNRYQARRWLLDNSSNERVRGCGMTSLSGAVTVNLGTCPTTGNNKASASNLITCGSLWLCPTCSLKTSTVRANELGAASESWTRQGGAKLFVTFTLRHTANMTLEQVWDGLAGSWRHFLGGKGWKNLKARFELAGWVRAVEVTHGKNGWHVHAHTVFFVDPNVEVNVEQFTNHVFSRWQTAVNSQGFTAERAAFDVRRTYSDSPLARYMSKNSNSGLGFELSNGSGKSSRTPFAILYKLVERQQTSCSCNGPRLPAARCDYCLWKEWEDTATGRRQMSWSVGMRDLIKCEEVAADTDDIVFDSVPVLAIRAGSWQYLVRGSLVTDLYDQLETLGVDAACSYLDSRELLYQRITT